MEKLFHGEHQIPARCLHVYNALAGKGDQPEYARRNGRWRYIDLVVATGRNSSGRKLRELIAACPGLVNQETIQGERGAFKVFWLDGDPNKVTVKPGTGGRLFDMPMRGRPE